MMRSIRELLQVLVDNHEQLYLNEGLCIANSFAQRKQLISTQEYYVIKDYVDKNLPMPYVHDGLQYAFPYGETKPRLDWLSEQIKKLE